MPDPQQFLNTVSEPSFMQFDSLVKQYGISLSNYYTITFDQSKGGIYQKINPNYASNLALIEYYCDEVSLPGMNISTGEYSINGAPQYKYGYKSTYSEASMTFLCDAYMNQKKVFDAWMNKIHEMSPNRATGAGVGQPLISRVGYFDDVVGDILVAKYERFGNGARDKFLPFDPNSQKDPLLAGYTKISPPGEPAKYFYSGQLRYSARLVNAFPTSISSISLSGGSSQINRVTVTFEYQYHLLSSLEYNNLEVGNTTKPSTNVRPFNN